MRVMYDSVFEKWGGSGGKREWEELDGLNEGKLCES